MLGYTEEELTENFGPHLEDLAQTRGQSLEDLRAEIRTFYNGFRFTSDPGTVYNPYSTLRFFESHKLKPYWFASGTPTFLLDQIKGHPLSAAPIGGVSVNENQLSDIHDLEQIDLKALMFQSGYLTVSQYDPRSQIYNLDFPNKEVRDGFFESLVTYFIPEPLRSEADLASFALEEKNLPGFFDHIKRVFASFPYSFFVRAREATYHGLFYAILRGMGVKAQAEVITNRGRVDLVIYGPPVTYIMELKLDQSPALALDQIRDRGYGEAFPGELVFIGVSFSSNLKNIEDWKVVT
jgi:hypothetical protein